MSLSLNKIFPHAGHDLMIRELTLDSRNVRAGDLFLAVPGGKLDGREHIADALKRGAAAVAYEVEGADVLPITAVPLIPVKGVGCATVTNRRSFLWRPEPSLEPGRRHWHQRQNQRYPTGRASAGPAGAALRHRWHPGDRILWRAAKRSPYHPDPIAVQAMLADLKKAGAKAVAMEVSSHGLDQGRVSALAFDVAVLTNLSRDHLDYHGTMQAYAEAKAKLFAWSDLGCRVLNLDDDFGRQLAAQKHDSRLISYSLEDSSAYLYCREATFDDDGVRALLVTPQGEHHLRSSLLGRFNLSNVLAAVGALLGLDYALDEILAVLPKLEGPVGRMQRLGGGTRPLVVVDYAHTPDALEKVLLALRPHAKGRLLCLFGCGGDRDRGKRPLMAEVVERLADGVLVTDDNPRSEAPAQIFDDIRAGFDSPEGINFVAGRGPAIAQIIAGASADDVIVLAGKGHEDYQEINGERHDFSDLVEAEKALNAWEAAHA